MTEANELYQELILDHGRRPRNFRVLEGAMRRADGHNPLCGDKITVFLRLEGDVVADVTFQGSGCAISTASASIMTDGVRGKTLAEVEEVFGHFHDLVTGKPVTEEESEELGKLSAFSGMSEFPMRVKCATLAWHTLRAALAGADTPVSTE